jgi:hypothetical protein
MRLLEHIWTRRAASYALSVQNRLTRTDTPEGSILYDYHYGDQLSRISEGGESLSYTWDGSLLKEVLYQGELGGSIQ